MSQPIFKWSVLDTRDYASAVHDQRLWLSILDVADGGGKREWRGQALILEESHGVTLMEDVDVGSGDIVEAMVECERRAAAAIVELCGGLVR